MDVSNWLFQRQVMPQTQFGGNSFLLGEDENFEGRKRLSALGPECGGRRGLARDWGREQVEDERPPHFVPVSSAYSSLRS